jgi:hypothetical protein
MINQTLAGAADNLMANQRPLLFLDTCDLVNLLQVLTTVPVPELRAVNRLLDALAANPQHCQPVGTYVTAIEFAQKTDPINPVYIEDSMGRRMPPDEVTYQLAVIDAQLVRLHQVRQEFGVPLPAATIYAGLGLLADLRVTAEMLFDVCWALEREQTCVNAAVQRVLDKRRPSHKREVKDSIHLEHCLDLARRIRLEGFAEQIIFASANKNDYGPAVAQQPHPDLQFDFAAVNMTYFDSLGDAIVHLGI